MGKESVLLDGGNMGTRLMSQVSYFKSDINFLSATPPDFFFPVAINI